MVIGRLRPPGFSRPVGVCQNSREGAGLPPVLEHLVSLPVGGGCGVFAYSDASALGSVHSLATPSRGDLKGSRRGQGV